MPRRTPGIEVPAACEKMTHLTIPGRRAHFATCWLVCAERIRVCWLHALESPLCGASQLNIQVCAMSLEVLEQLPNPKYNPPSTTSPC